VAELPWANAAMENAPREKTVIAKTITTRRKYIRMSPSISSLAELVLIEYSDESGELCHPKK
jgi:hypothetical protein